MIQLPTNVQLNHVDGILVEAEHVILTPEMASDGVLKSWWEWNRIPKDRLLAERDSTWPWDAIASKSLDHDFFEALALRTPDQRIQGCIQYALSNYQDSNETYGDCHSSLVPGAGTVYVELLATAPWNRLELMGDKREFQGVGKALLVFAICASYNMGYGGSLKLDAYPRVFSVYQAFGFEYIEELEGGTLLMELPSNVGLKKLQERNLL